MMLQRRIRFVIAFVLVFMLSVSSVVRVYSMSTILQTYEEKVCIPIFSYYKLIATYEGAHYRIQISIETESDGTWRKNKNYSIILEIVREWYNQSLCPHGISLIIRMPSMAWGLPQTIDGEEYHYDKKKTIIDWLRTTYVVKCDIGYIEEENIKIDPEIFYYVYNTSICDFIGKDEYLVSLGHWYLPQFWISVRPDPRAQRQTEFSNIQTQINLLKEELTYIKNLMYVLILTIVILIATALYFEIRKTKVKT